jgi:hypothetical protein
VEGEGALVGAGEETDGEGQHGCKEKNGARLG